MANLIKQSWKTLNVSLVDRIFTISMNRPKVNSMSIELLNDLEQAFDYASENEQIKGVHLRSNMKYYYFSLSLLLFFSIVYLVQHSLLVLIFRKCTNDVVQAIIHA